MVGFLIKVLGWYLAVMVIMGAWSLVMQKIKYPNSPWYTYVTSFIIHGVFWPFALAVAIYRLLNDVKRLFYDKEK